MSLQSVMTERGNIMLIFNGFKFNHKLTLKSNDKKWTCSYKGCPAKFFTTHDNKITPSSTQNLTHNHEKPNPKDLTLQSLQGACKRKATQDICERPCKIIQTELSEVMPKVGEGQLTRDDIRKVRMSMWYARRKKIRREMSTIQNCEQPRKMSPVQNYEQPRKMPPVQNFEQPRKMSPVQNYEQPRDASQIQMKESNMVQLFSKKYLENIANVFKTLYRDEDLCDVTLCCRGGTLKAHRLILAASSPYFYRIFREHKAQTPVVILHGITIRQLQNLLDLIYKGNADIEPEELDDLYSLAKELEINGVLDIDKSSSNGQTGFLSMDSAHNIDTRYKGHKRVAVDFALQEKTAKFCKIEPKTPRNSIDKKHAEELPPRVVMSPSDLNLQRKIPIVKTELQVNGISPPNKVNNSSANSANGDNPENGSPKLTAWARKQRKFQCELCPSSFKRSSHLTRHQLVHTGERPYACDQCDKAFSRHDKLKHHIKKAHEEPYVDHTMTGYYPHSFEELPSPQQQQQPKQQHQQTPTMSPKVPKVEPESTPDDALFTISHITSVLEDSFEGPKKGRGRPRKYPPVPVQIPTVKRGRGRPRLTPSQKDEQYDLTNLPFGDLEFLTRPIQNQSEQTDPGSLLEPYVEIQTNDSEKNRNENSFEAEENSLHLNESVEFGDVSSTFENSVNISKINSNIISNMTNNGLEITSTSSGENVLSKQVLNDIENKIAKIGECTISVAN